LYIGDAVHAPRAFGDVHIKDVWVAAFGSLWLEVDNVVLSMQTFPMEQGEDMVAYFERLMEYIDSLKKK